MNNCATITLKLSSRQLLELHGLLCSLVPIYEWAWQVDRRQASIRPQFSPSLPYSPSLHYLSPENTQLDPPASYSFGNAEYLRRAILSSPAKVTWVIQYVPAERL